MADHAKTLADALVETAASLAAAISLLERSPKTAAPSNKMFDIMLQDYRKSLRGAREAHAAYDAHHAEAAARENGDLVKRIEEAVRGASNPLGNPTHGYHCGFLSGREEALKAILPIITTLSTHQQQLDQHVWDHPRWNRLDEENK